MGTDPIYFEVEKLDALIERMNAQDLAFVVHVGDIGSSARGQACSDAWLEARRQQFANLRHPFVLLPGDNEWSDCAKHGLDPLARLARWREIFCTDSRALALERQPGHCENVRWQAGGMAFIGLNVPGGGRPDLADARIFILMHADPRFERVGDSDAYARLRAVLATHAAWFGERLVLVHGDTHVYRDDAPLPGLRRLEVWGSPFVSWLRVAGAGRDIEVAAGH